MNHLSFSRPERALALIAGIFNLIVGTIFLFFPAFPPDLQLLIWPVSISAVLARFVGAIILGNAVGAIWLSTEHEWARVRPLALVAAVYGTVVAVALLYHLLWLNAQPFFWLYFAFDLPFLLVFYALFLYHDIIPLFSKRRVTHPQTKRAEVG